MNSTPAPTVSAIRQNVLNLIGALTYLTPPDGQAREDAIMRARHELYSTCSDQAEFDAAIAEFERRISA